jgi:hypothetical protein
MSIARFFMLAPLAAVIAFGDYAEDKKKYDACVAKVRKDYPVPPGNANTLRQMIQNDCGNPPTPPKK